MIVFLWCLYILSASVRLIGWLFFRLWINPGTPTKASTATATEGISVVVCAHNNLKGLQQLLPHLVAQEFPWFEIIVVDDRSSDQTGSWLAEQAKQMGSLKVISIAQTPENWNAKKYALSQGIKAAQYPLLALTDSDCIPFSQYWLQHVAKQLSPSGRSIFLGYSPYEEQSGLLSKIIKTETFFTALQYFSMARAGLTYMGVGRNLGYRKSFLDKHLDNFPFQNHLGGDDDLLINQLSEGSDAAICVDAESFVLTFPPKDLKTWWKQKRRHLSAGIQYKLSTKTILGTYWLSASLFWLTFIALFLFSPGDQCLLLLTVHLGFFAVGSIILFPLFRIFKAVRLLPLFLFWDFLYIASSSIIGFSTFLVKNKKWN